MKILNVARRAMGAAEAKTAGTPTGVEAQSARYAAALPDSLRALIKDDSHTDDAAHVARRIRSKGSSDECARLQGEYANNTLHDRWATAARTPAIRVNGVVHHGRRLTRASNFRASSSQRIKDATPAQSAH